MGDAAGNSSFECFEDHASNGCELPTRSDAQEGAQVLSRPPLQEISNIPVVVDGTKSASNSTSKSDCCSQDFSESTTVDLWRANSFCSEIAPGAGSTATSSLECVASDSASFVLAVAATDTSSVEGVPSDCASAIPQVASTQGTNPLAEEENSNILNHANIPNHASASTHGHSLAATTQSEFPTEVEESIVAEGFEQLASQLQLFRAAPSQFPSSFARLLRAFHNETIHGDLRILGALVDMVDPMSQALHVESEKHLPRSAALNGGLDSTYARMTGVPRKESCAWMLCATFNVQLPDDLFFTTVNQLDRFYAAKHRRRMSSSSPDTLPPADAASVAQVRLLASINLVLKTHGTRDDRSRRPVIAQLSCGFCRVEQVYKAELPLLDALDYNTTVPTSLDFLIVLSKALQGTLSGCITSLSNFLLHLSLVEAAVHYKYPHAVLSAAALSLAFWVFGSPSALYKQVFGDLLIIMFPSSGTTEERGADPTRFGTSDLAPPEASQSMGRDICGDITRCAWELHQLWWRHCSSYQSCIYAGYLRQKFLAPQTHFVASLVPPQLPLPLFPPNTQQASEYASYLQGWFASQRQVGAMPL